MASEYEASDEELLRAFGLLTVRAAKLESDLRDAFCCLVGSKYAVVVAAGQQVSWLIDQCQALLKANLEISDDHKAPVKAALEACKSVTEQRNTLIHSVKANIAPEGSLMTARSRRGTFQPATETWTLESVRAVNSRVTAARIALKDAINDALSDARDVLGQLRLETDARYSEIPEQRAMARRMLLEHQKVREYLKSLG